MYFLLCTLMIPSYVMVLMLCLVHMYINTIPSSDDRLKLEVLADNNFKCDKYG